MYELTVFGDAWPRPITHQSLLYSAASSGCWSAVAAASRRVPGWVRAAPFPSWVVYGAVKRGDLLTTEKLHGRVRYEPHIAMEIAGSAGQLELVEWLYQHSRSAKSPSRDVVVIDLVAGLEESQSLGFEFVNWNVYVSTAKKNLSYRFCAARDGLLPKLPPTSSAQKQPYPLLAHATSVGDLKLVEKLLERESRSLAVCLEHTLPMAAANGKTDVVRWLLEAGKSSSAEIPQAMVAVAQQGHFDVLAYLHDEAAAYELAIPLREQEQLRVAALHGHLHVVQFLVLRLRVDVTAQVFDNAARQGHGRVVVWLAEHCEDAPLPATLLRSAVDGGNATLVKWLVEEMKVPLYRAAIDHAAEQNHVEVMRFLHSHAVELATREGTSVQQIFDYDSLSLSVLRRQGSLCCATWLVENISWVDAAYSERDLRGVDKWYEVELRRELGMSFRGDRLDLGHDRIPANLVSQRQALDVFLVALVRYRPLVAARVQWLPRWAVWTRSVEVLRLLAAMAHSELSSTRTFRAALTFTKDHRLVKWLLHHFETKDMPPAEASAVRVAVQKWTIKHRQWAETM